MSYRPLADEIRPQSLDEVVGQRHILGENGLLRRIIESGHIPNLVFYGPSGTGKTTVANIIARRTNRPLHRLNATTASISDIKDIIKDIGTMLAPDGVLLYLDEIQYFNKKQQQSLLEFMENGSLTLIASTTENPYFYVYNAVLSRSTVFEFKPIEAVDVLPAIDRGIRLMGERLGAEVDCEDGVREHIATACGGDVRKSMNAVELLLSSARREGERLVVTLADAQTVAQRSAMRYDREGDDHYDIASALMKSMRGSDPDAALHYLARLLEADRQYSEANEIYNSLIEQDPDNPDIWIRMVEGQIRAGKGQKALDYALNGPATYGYKLTAATLFLDARMYPEAEALLDGLKSDPNAPDEVHFYLAAIAYEYHKDVQETLNFLESIPPENRFYDRALRLRIQLLHDQQRYEDAMQLILQGQSQFPTERDFRLMEIHLYLLQDRYKEALTAATAAQQIWPSDDEIAYVYGSVLDSLGRKREALAMMESIVARNPEDYQALNYVGYSLAEQGKDLDRAVLLLEAALKQAPDHAYILDSLAWAHFRRGENAEAWALVRRATSLPDGGDPTIWEHYGDIANAQGLKNEARTGWERALELDHPNPETIRKKLNSL